MLVQISIRNLAIVDSLDLEFGPGITALTGETGAGKSILVDALGLAAGGRASSAAVRPGCERAEVTAVFEVGGVPEVFRLLEELELEDAEGQCVLRRIVGADGRSRAFVNGTPVSAGTLRRLGDRLVDIHGQHSHHALLRRDEQRRLLDEYARHGELVGDVAASHRRWLDLQRRMDAELDAGEDPAARLDYLRFQWNELEALDLSTEALTRINEEHARLSHVEELLQSSGEAMAALDDDDSNCARQSLAQALRAVRRIGDIDGSLAGVRQLLEQAAIEIDEASAQIRDYRDRLDADPAKLEQLERMLSSIHDLSRKHRVKADELPKLASRLREEIDALQSRDERLAALEADRDRALAQYRTSAESLSRSRSDAAGRLAREVSENLSRLGMEGARFEVRVEKDESRPPASHGTDGIEFLVAANRGLPLQPVARTASGGELSRISLAIQVVDSSATGIPTVVFDEVDVGVGGRHADVVGKMLRKLSETRQTLCITHQPQVASRAHHHARIMKSSTADTTTTAVQYLLGEQRVEEVARMLGGAEPTRKTVDHARELIERA
ncbi:MAG: DNA repair protein RecN [Gammaproteobacteria bacterium]|nr:DNA repair protein RecN [Gammaproteobacteria bacterium]